MLVETALQRWEEASLGKLNFIHSTTAFSSDIINIGTGDLAAVAAVGGMSGDALGIGGGFASHGLTTHPISSAYAWMDFVRTWDTTIGNGNPVGTFDYFTVAAQEIGHALGLGHLDDLAGADIMDGTYIAERTAYSANDVTHVQSLYNPLSSGILTVTGSEGADTFSASVSSGILNAVYNGTTSTFDASSVSSISLDAGGGNDSATLDGTVTVSTTLLGGAGNDTISGGGGNDSIGGGLDFDLLSGNAGNDTVSGGQHGDTLNGNAGNDLIIGGMGLDSLGGGQDNDTLQGGLGNDTLLGGIGIDTADYLDRLLSTQNLTITLDTLANDGETGIGEADNVGGTANDIEIVTSGAGSDSITGNSFANTLLGNAGNDTIYGGDGDDSLGGGSGNDFLNGQFGSDTFISGLGNDQLYGESGDDWFYVRDGLADTIFGGGDYDRAQIDSALDVLTNVEELLA